MTNFEMVEKLREKANVSYEEAKAALEQSNWDLLDAMLILEQQGKVNPGAGRYSTRIEEEPAADSSHRKARSFWNWLSENLKKLVHIGNTNFFVVARKGEEQFSLPVTVVALVLILSFWTPLILLAVGLFFGFRYSFRGPNLGKPGINSVLNRAADAAESASEELRSRGQQENKDK